MNDLSIVLSNDCGRHLYEQIYDYIKGEIKEGRLLEGEKLPSTRSLADFLQVSRSTVELSYEQLLSEGYIEAKPYKGYFVCRMEEFIHVLPGNAGEETKAVCGKTEQEDGKRFDFSPNAVDMTAFPFATWKKITKNILVDANSELFALGSPKGDEELRITISRYLHMSRGVNCKPEQIIVGAGNDYLLMLLEKILGRHIRIAMENPTYKRAYRIFTSFAYEVLLVQSDENGMLAESLREQNAKAAYVMPSHQYPTGAVMPIGRRLELLKWASEEEERYLIEDDYDSEFRYRGKPVPALQASDMAGRVIYIGTFSKAIAPAIRVSYMVLPEKLLKRYEETCFFYSSTVSRIDQKILNEFIEKGHFERHLNKMRKRYKGKHDLLLWELRELMEDFTLSGDKAGLHILLTDKKGRSEVELLKAASDAGVMVYGLSDAFVKPEKEAGNATVILGYAALQEEQIKEGVKRLKEAWLD